MVRRQTAAVVFCDDGFVGDAQQRVMRGVHVFLAEMHIVGCNQGNFVFVGEFDQVVFDALLRGRRPCRRDDE